MAGGAAGDTINGGAGNDTITITTGADAITTGTGNDILDINAADTAGASQVATLLNSAGVTLAANDVIQVQIDGTLYTETYATSAAATHTAFVTSHAANILANHGVTVTSIDTNTDLAFTGNANGTSFQIAGSINDAGVTTAYNAATLTNIAGTVALDTNSSIADFSSTDVINSVGIAALGTGGYYEGAAGAAVAGTDYGVVVLTGAAYATSTLAATALNARSTSATDAIVVYLDSTTGKAEAYFDDNIGGNDVALGDLFAFDDVTTLADLAATFSTASFVI